MSKITRYITKSSKSQNNLVLQADIYIQVLMQLYLYLHNIYIDIEVDHRTNLLYYK